MASHKSLKLVDSLAERTTAATDLFLSAAATGAVLYLQQLPHHSSGRFSPWPWFFGLVALSAAMGAAYHGLVLTGTQRRFLWQILTGSLGMAISFFVVGVIDDLWGAESARRTLPIMLAAGLIIFAVSRMLLDLFVVFILYEALALLIALAAYAWMAASEARPGAGWMATGILVSMIAAGIQTARNWHVRFIGEFDHNGMFHLVQVLGLILICVGLSG